MIDPTAPPEEQIARQARIIEALVARAERADGVGDSAYALFQSAIALQAEVWQKTRDLESALDRLGRTSSDLEIAHQAQERVQKTLADALVAMEGGFALFFDDRLQVCNTLFRKLLPDIEPLIQPGLGFDTYLAALKASRSVSHLDGCATPNGGQPFSAAVMGLKNDRWFQISCHRTSSATIAVLQAEITDVVRENRRQKTLLIDQQAQVLQAAFDHMALGVCTFSASGDLMLRNDSFGALLGVPLALLTKGTAFQRIVEHVERHDLLDRKSRRPEFARWFKAVKRGVPVQERFRRHDGISLDLRLNALPDGGFLVSVMDVTAETEAAAALEARVAERTAALTEANRLLQVQSAEQARTEDALRLAKEAAEAAHTSKTRFLAAASHDLLQPINAAKLYISTLMETVTAPAARETVIRLGRSFTSVESLLHALLDISRLDSAGAEFNVTSFCLEPMMQALAADLAPLAAEKGLELRVVPSRRWVTSDLRYLARCVQNLVVNAIQYTEKGRVLVGARVQGDRLLIEVWDTGIGISEPDQARIFQEFTRVGGVAAGSGMGLGLSIVERACRHLGHPVRLVSQPGLGSMFAIDLPLASPATADLPQPQPPETTTEGSLDLIVLLVENDADVLHATTQRLESWGASVLAARSTTAALALLHEVGSPPDILLADYQLDGDDTGVAAIRALRAQAGFEVPAIMITANRSKALLRQGAEMGFSLLPKPVPLARLRALIDWKTRRAPPETTDKGLR
ncbi:hybrid sensor histidine kinase/response regulator [Rhodobacter ferrooxidans]|uniref:histidine kinase n=1 Tax=Rhodobacter ferrooxidans TaxID=371731 RepID=C8S582_9RHOB|nr:PAS-domain containing protein [Rhodobacter sp. SW2]EEW23878.1 histidine kinase [Rhodobacter sp. SW2]